MNVEHRTPVVVGQLPDDAVTKDAGVVDHHVDPPGSGEDIVDPGRHRCRVGNVDLERDHALVIGRDGGQRLGVDVGDGNGGARVDEEVGQCTPDAASTAGHDDGASGEVECDRHGCTVSSLPFSWLAAETV